MAAPNPDPRGKAGSGQGQRSAIGDGDAIVASLPLRCDSPTALRLRALTFLAPHADRLLLEQRARGDIDEGLAQAIDLLDAAAAVERGGGQ